MPLVSDPTFDGFVAAGMGSAIGAKIGPVSGGVTWRNAGKAFASITLGGTLSKITGGKFANGAASAAFVVAVSGAAEKALGSGGKSDSSIFNDTDNLGEGRELYDGQVIIKKYGSPDAVVTDAEFGTVRGDLESIFSKGGEGGARLQSAMSSGDPTTIILNDRGVNAASAYNSRLLTVDLNMQHEFLNFTTSQFQQFSTARILTHELGHAVLGYRDVGLPITMNILGRSKEVTSYPNVTFTDGVMHGIDGSARNVYQNYCAPRC